MTQALTNVMLMDAVIGCLQNQRSISAASKLAYFDKIKHEGQDLVFRCSFFLLYLCFKNKAVVTLYYSIFTYSFPRC